MDEKASIVRDATPARVAMARQKLKVKDVAEAIGQRPNTVTKALNAPRGRTEVYNQVLVFLGLPIEANPSLPQE